MQGQAPKPRKILHWKLDRSKMMMGHCPILLSHCSASISFLLSEASSFDCIA